MSHGYVTSSLTSIAASCCLVVTGTFSTRTLEGTFGSSKLEVWSRGGGNLRPGGHVWPGGLFHPVLRASQSFLQFPF